MNQPVKQHLIDPEICIRCYTCEMTCPIGAIEHDDMNVVVNADICNFCMDCIPVCPTGSIDEWRVVAEPYTLAQQYEMEELPEQEDIEVAAESGADDPIETLLAEAHKGAGGKAKPPASASKPAINMYTLGKPATLKVQGNYRLTDDPEHDVRHIILDPGALPFPVLEGQSVGIIPPGKDADGNAHLPRLYSVSSPRDGERPGYHNISLTVKREDKGLASNFLCDLKLGDSVDVTGPFGATFLMPSTPDAHLLLICTGTGSAPMRAFTMQRQRSGATGGMTMFFGARSPETLPYFGPLKKIPDSLLKKHLVFSRLPDQDKEYVQDRMIAEQDSIAEILQDEKTHIYICGLRGMEEGVELALTSIAESMGQQWTALRDAMREDGRYHVETY
ncbi:benzoyl-CoA 2,3-epoxidase subunit BoxA [Sulfitobacter sp. M57]|uniref:benzoyl-CoA 2,3-epoxidase subunit BoxA n=1 Tax=unclassified Sulfitobacter TaxID=196795 RepID=UPI0023E27FD8|nr:MULTISPECIES: benzoyl-CoA 2,3-epoxidase subunit BoxA [unclassified Sulfitobacter]MDF3416257.1 benzoyl-CoA 2,3-epoxidase subunit BoxA [Sulfitobacter sp. KE5]MDF3423736.1 benzoyl-CoA 2,3-epoxidase subunit BoxA [Sulfitobacter sp. KE43]MDF3434803.1 benzoyl-CoA 2,3-epoxidase subunit BoxA [Sulfitobacter sp. KE42]MDF3460442.1 benzoyl-CoA 2,3-epoxidase subunit BoxA [Sulfitobacter sp. S74]MDF3464340.1 benzoyl-CoA 2,3-epoxidase subunit BoxA [Sulfitobacter sp. Ks18]